MSRHYPVLTSRQLLDFHTRSPCCRRTAAHKISPISLRSDGCRMTTSPGLASSAYNLGAPSRWWPLKAMAGSESGLPPRCTSLCERGRISPPVTGRQPKLSKSQHHVGSVFSVEGHCSVSPSIICSPADEDPGKISPSKRKPARSKVLICERALAAKQLYQHKRINCTDRFFAALSTQTIISLTTIDQRP